MNLIQSTFGNVQHGNFELVTREGSNLVHYFRDNSNPSGAWQKGRVISSAATGEGWIIQSRFGAPPIYNFEVIVQEGANLVHYYRDNSNPQGDWQKGRVITDDATGPGSLIQSDFGGAAQGNFEVVVPEGSKLVHYYRDNRFPAGPWFRASVITEKATGPAHLIQGTFGRQPGGNFELVVLEGGNLVHYYRDNTQTTSPWVRGQVISADATGPGTILQSNFGGAIGNFEVVVPEGTKLTHYYHDNTSANSVWQRGATVRA